MVNMAYDIHARRLTAVGSNTGTRLLIDGCSSGFSNNYGYAHVRAVGSHSKDGKKRHQCGGPIPIGNWRVLLPGARHPDPGNHRPDWIPIGPITVYGRTLIYIHCGTISDGCINVPLDQRALYDQLKKLVRDEQGGWIRVTTSQLESCFTSPLLGSGR